MKYDGIQVAQDHPVVTHEERLAAREAFLREEKQFTRLREGTSCGARCSLTDRGLRKFDGGDGGPATAASPNSMLELRAFAYRIGAQPRTCWLRQLNNSTAIRPPHP